jgi:hypothetical protein
LTKDLVIQFIGCGIQGHARWKDGLMSNLGGDDALDVNLDGLVLHTIQKLIIKDKILHSISGLLICNLGDF